MPTSSTSRASRPAARRAPRQDEPAARRRRPAALARLCRRHDARSQDADLRAAARGDAREVRQAPARRRAARPSSTPIAPASATCPASTTCDLLDLLPAREGGLRAAYEAANRPAWLSIPLHGLASPDDPHPRRRAQERVMTAHAAIRRHCPRAGSRCAGARPARRSVRRARPARHRGRAASSAPSCPARTAVEVLRRSDRAVDRHARAAAAGRAVRGHRGRSRALSAAHHLAGRGAGDRGSLFLRPAARRSRPASVQRGPPFRAGQGARRQCHDARRRRRRALRGLGAECQPRRRGRRLQRLGFAAPSDAPALSRRRLGAVRAAPGAGRALQVRDRRRRRRAAAAEGRSAGRADRDAARHRFRRRLARAVSTGTTQAWMAGRAAAPGDGRADLDLRGPSRLVDATAASADAGTTRPTG